MAEIDIPLDYGSGLGDEAVHEGSFSPRRYAEEEEEIMDVDGNDMERNESGSRGTRFYALPAEEGISAGANRGVKSLSRAELNKLDEERLLGPEDESDPPPSPRPESSSDVRLDTLHIEGLPITQLSTSRLFAYVTHFGAQPLGLEWVNDQRCNVVFPSESSARLGLEYLCPAQDMDSAPLPSIEELQSLGHDHWQEEHFSSLCTFRKAHRVPGKLYNTSERETATSSDFDPNGGNGSSLPDDVPEIYRELEQAERLERQSQPAYQALRKLRSSLWVRYALKSHDIKPSDAAKRSQWYREHGIEAGRDVVPKLLNVGEVGEAVELFPESDGAEATPSSQPAKFTSPAAPIGLPERPDWFVAATTSEVRKGRGSANKRAVMDDLDAELDQHLASRDQEDQGPAEGDESMDQENRRLSNLSRSRWGRRDTDEVEERYGEARTRRRGRGAGEGRAVMDSLDEELDDRNRQRSASPIAARASKRKEEGDLFGAPAEGRMKIKGRGAMKAPSGDGFSRGWGDDEDLFGRDPAGRNRRGRGGRRNQERELLKADEKSLASRLASDQGSLLNRIGEGGRSLSERLG
ncbi:hypothetical protein IE53DRAFT_240072 [Violaceomyces palustris]|uniref:Uncharacterized protein n=1 Tax=Violaceomyces palustris TaxID=1673888 RepID=A0ACD0P4A2_9BASI|nr:hypothetical protein IE53DRAFT_240072 [Violaceomyces palustris]